MKKIVFLISLGLSMSLLTSCAGVPSVHPTANFCPGEAKEFSGGNNSPTCVEIAKDPVAQNAPKEDR